MFDYGEDASFPLEHINSNVMRCLRKPKQFFLVYLVIADLRVSNLQRLLAMAKARRFHLNTCTAT
jgi:hypothetical protein